MSHSSRGALALGEEALDVIAGRRSIRAGERKAPSAAGVAPGSILNRKRRTSSPSKAPASSGRAERPSGDLLTALRDHRDKLAKKSRLQPFKIVHDATLRQIAEVRPENHAELSVISGIGPAKLARYGDAILEIVQRHPSPAPTPGL